MITHLSGLSYINVFYSKKNSLPLTEIQFVNNFNYHEAPGRPRRLNSQLLFKYYIVH